MKRFKEYFKEKRKFAEKNPFIGAWDVLAKYVNDPDVYISFTDIDKIGINPRSVYETPLGIYTYPLKEFYEKYLYDYMRGDYQGLGRFTELTPTNLKHVGIATQFSIGKFAPFAGGTLYINFIRSNNIPKVVNDMYKDYTESDLNKDINILKKKYSKIEFHDQKKLNSIPKDILKDIFEYRVMNKKLPSLIKYHKELPDVYKYFVKLFKGDTVKLVTQINRMFHDKYPFTEDKFYKMFYNINQYVFEDEVITLGIAETNTRHPISKMWSITRKLAKKLTNYESSIKLSTKWNSILSKDLGYSMFADKSGERIIHSGEPMQAVFLNTKAFTLLDRLPNVPNKDINKARPNETI